MFCQDAGGTLTETMSNQLETLSENMTLMDKIIEHYYTQVKEAQKREQERQQGNPPGVGLQA